MKELSGFYDSFIQLASQKLAQEQLFWKSKVTYGLMSLRVFSI